MQISVFHFYFGSRSKTHIWNKNGICIIGIVYILYTYFSDKFRHPNRNLYCIWQVLEKFYANYKERNRDTRIKYVKMSYISQDCTNTDLHQKKKRVLS